MTELKEEGVLVYVAKEDLSIRSEIGYRLITGSMVEIEKGTLTSKQTISYVDAIRKTIVPVERVIKFIVKEYFDESFLNL